MTNDISDGRPVHRDRHAVKAGDLTDAEVALIATAEVPVEHGHLDDELKHWHP